MSFCLSVIAKTHSEAVCLEKGLEAIVREPTKEDMLKRKLDIEFVEPWGYKGGGGAATGGT